MELVYRICVRCGNDGISLFNTDLEYICPPCEEEIYKESYEEEER